MTFEVNATCWRDSWNRDTDGDRFQKASWLEWNECPVYETMAYRRPRPEAEGRPAAITIL